MFFSSPSAAASSPAPTSQSTMSHGPRGMTSRTFPPRRFLSLLESGSQLLVAGGSLQAEAIREGATRPGRETRSRHAQELSRGAGPSDPPRHGLPMGPPREPRSALQGMAEGVAEVQDGAPAVFPRILLHDPALDRKAPPDHLLHDPQARGQDTSAPRCLEQRKKRLVPDQRGLDHLSEARDIFPLGKAAERGNVDDGFARQGRRCPRGS